MISKNINGLDIGSDFSGVGAFNQSLKKLGIEYNEVFACDMDKFARQTFELNYGKPKYYPENVYSRDIPKKPLDIYMTSPPCQSFSLAGKRGGEDDERGLLFYNSHEFIVKNNPRYFIFENVKGLISDDNGKTFARWCDYLGGKSINGNPVIFPHEKSVPYHIFYKIMNAKDFGIPQNRERIFIIGVRDDVDNNFSFPKDFFLKKRLINILQNNVHEKYYLSKNMIDGFIETNKEEGYINKKSQSSKVFNKNGVFQNLCSGTHGYCNGYVIVKSANIIGREIARPIIDSINLDHPKSKTRRGRVGIEVSQTLTTSCNIGICDKDYRVRKLTPRECFRLMGFPDDFIWECSDSQAYKQAGNSIVVNVLEEILKKLLKI